MKKFLAFILAMIMVLSFAGCGKSTAVKAAEDAIDAIGEVTADSGEAIANAEKLYGILTDSEKSDVDNRLVLVEAQEKFENLQGEVVYSNAKKAYEKLNEVAELCTKGMDDIYGAWYFGIYKAGDSSSSSVFSDFANETPHLSKSELETAASKLGIDKYDIKDDWQNCLYVAEMAIMLKGDYDTIETKMAEAEDILQELTTEYDDYAYYPKLKEYYSAVSSYVEFFTSPSGSFKQLSDTVNNYENNIRTLQSDVSFLFTK